MAEFPCTTTYSVSWSEGNKDITSLHTSHFSAFQTGKWTKVKDAVFLTASYKAAVTLIACRWFAASRIPFRVPCRSAVYLYLVKVCWVNPIHKALCILACMQLLQPSPLPTTWVQNLMSLCQYEQCNAIQSARSVLFVNKDEELSKWLQMARYMATGYYYLWHLLTNWLGAYFVYAHP